MLIKTFRRYLRNTVNVGVVSLLLTSVSGVAAAEPKRDPASGVESSVRDGIVESLRTSFPDLPVISVSNTPVANLLEVELDGGQIIYVSRNGQFLLSGDLYQLEPTVVNLAEGSRSERRKQIMDQVPIEEMVVFSPVGEPKEYINVFTDVDCGYCRKLHQEVPELNALGVEVRYLAYPRAGFDTPTFAKIVSAWCSENRNKAITALKAGKSIPEKQCENPVSEHFQIGQSVGVTGTPAIVTSSGKLLPGYMPAADLAAAIGLQ
jgi:thiol:disulfide interchange protein DsbC